MEVFVGVVVLLSGVLGLAWHRLGSSAPFGRLPTASAGEPREPVVVDEAFRSLNEADRWAAVLTELRPAYFALFSHAIAPLGDGFYRGPNTGDGVARLRQSLLLLAELGDPEMAGWCREAEQEAGQHSGHVGAVRDICESTCEVFVERLVTRWADAGGRALADAHRDELRWLNHRQRGALLLALGESVTVEDVAPLGEGLDGSTALTLLERLAGPVASADLLAQAFNTLLTAADQDDVDVHEALAGAIEDRGGRSNLPALHALLARDGVPRLARLRYLATVERLERRFGLSPGGLVVCDAAVDAASSVGGLSHAEVASASGRLLLAPAVQREAGDRDGEVLSEAVPETVEA